MLVSVGVRTGLFYLLLRTRAAEVSSMLFGGSLGVGHLSRRKQTLKGQIRLLLTLWGTAGRAETGSHDLHPIPLLSPSLVLPCTLRGGGPVLWGHILLTPHSSNLHGEGHGKTQEGSLKPGCRAGCLSLGVQRQLSFRPWPQVKCSNLPIRLSY